MADDIQILLLEDSEFDIAILSARLRSDGRFGVHSLRNLRDALGYLQAGRIDVILMDLNLPDSAGLQTFEAVNQAFPDLPIVILTGDDDLEKATRAVASGAQDYVPKHEGDIRLLSRSVLYAYERNARRLIQKRQDVVDNDLDVARRIQQHLLPHQAPQIPGFDVAALCRPVEACGGDFYDFIPHDHCWDIVIADVSGHGFAPAMIMAQTQTLLRALCGRVNDVGELVTAVNHELCRDTPEGHFVSMFYARLFPATRRLTYAIAGHPGAIYRSTGQVDRLQYGSPVLGVVPDFVYPTDGEVYLDPGDRFVLTTDGIQEVVSLERELFGQARVAQAIGKEANANSHDAIRTVVDAATEFAAPGGVQDDITILMLKCLAAAD